MWGQNPDLKKFEAEHLGLGEYAIERSSVYERARQERVVVVGPGL
jgi:hypothetical protein